MKHKFKQEKRYIIDSAENSKNFDAKISELELLNNEFKHKPKSIIENTSSMSEVTKRSSSPSFEKKGKFILDKLCPIIELTTLSKNEVIPEVVKAYTEGLPYDETPAPNPGQYSIYNIMTSADLIMSKYLMPHLKDEGGHKKDPAFSADNDPVAFAKKVESNNAKAFAALTLRIKRFQLKWLTISTLQVYAPNKTSAITFKLNDLTKEMRNTYVHLDLDKKPFNGVNFKSTVKRLAIIISNFEHQLRVLLPGILYSFNLTEPANIINLEQNKMKLLNDIAPFGFEGIEGDCYYICRLLMSNPQMLPFSLKQREQWLDYYKEFHHLFSFYSIPGLKFDLTLFNEKQHTINMPYSKFIALDAYSANTFSRIITASGRMITISWLTLLQALPNYLAEQAKANNIKP